MAGFKLLLLSLCLPLSQCFYVPGVAPENYKEGDDVEIKVGLSNVHHFLLNHRLTVSFFQAVKLTSIKLQLPYKYYSLPFCQPEKIQYKSENLGMLFLNFKATAIYSKLVFN